MAASQPWFGWLSGLLSGMWPKPAPDTHGAWLEEVRASALLDKELRKPRALRDDELVRELRVDYGTHQLRNLQARVSNLAFSARSFEEPIARECCAAAAWVWLRMAASMRAQHDYYCQRIEQVKEELAAAQERRPPVIVAEPALQLDLPMAQQQLPPRLDMCSKCAGWIEQMELDEESCEVDAETIRTANRQRGLQPAAAAAAASQEAAGQAAAAADLPAGAAQPQQQGQQQQQGQLHCDSVSGDAEGEPATPRLPPTPPKQRHTTSQQEQEQQRTSSHQEQQEQQE